MVSALNHSFMMRSTLLENKFSWFAFGSETLAEAIESDTYIFQNKSSLFFLYN